MFKLIIATAIGSSLGGILRWYFSLKLNFGLSFIPLGTLLSNLIAGYIIGFFIAFFNQSSLSAEWRLLIMTGFCGGLSTFSTFSLEVVTLLQAGRFSWAFLTISIHVLGSILLTYLGMLTFQWLK